MKQELKVTPLLEGKPFMTEFGIVGYSSVILVQEGDMCLLYDCGPKGCALQLKDALKAQGLGPEDITHVFLSHLHFDHTGNLGLFKDAKVCMSKIEWEDANNRPDEWQCVLTVSYLKERGNYQFYKEGDLLSPHVTVMELPGHTMGLLGLKCQDMILCSDALKNRYEMWEDIPLMSVDLEKSQASIARIKREGRFIFPGHDCMLDMKHPINEEPVSFDIRFANGKILHI